MKRILFITLFAPLLIFSQRVEISKILIPPKQIIQINKDLSKLEPIISLSDTIKKLENEIEGYKEILENENEEELRSLAKQELPIYEKDEFIYGLEDEIEKTIKSFDLGNKKQEHNLIDALKITCRKFTKEKIGKKPFTNINLIKI